MQEESILQVQIETDVEVVSESSHMVSLSECVQGMDKFQDQTYLGAGIDEMTGEDFKYAMVTDGHGTNFCINVLREITVDQMYNLMGKADPVDALAKHVNTRIPTNYQFGTGATVCLVKIYADRIVCINSGDSQAYVFCDGALVLKTKEHTYQNESEVARLLGMNHYIRFADSTSFDVIAENRLVQCDSKYAEWPDGQKLACTQALGHGGRTGYAPDVEIIPIDPGRSYQVVIGSDGIWDVMIKDSAVDAERLWGLDATGVVKFANDRWLQEWEMIILAEPDKIERSRFFPKECDDMGAAVVKIKAI